MFFFVRYRVTDHAINRKSAKSCLHKSTLDELKTKLFGKTKSTMLLGTKKAHGAHRGNFEEVQKIVFEPMSTDTFSKFSTIEVFKRVGLACLAQTSTHGDTLDSDVSSCAGRVIDMFLFSFYSCIFLSEFCSGTPKLDLHPGIEP